MAVKGFMTSTAILTHQAAAYGDGDSFGGAKAINIPVPAGMQILGLKLVAVRVIDRDQTSDFDLHLFNLTPLELATVLTENGAVTFADADVAGGVYLGFVDVDAADFVTGEGVSVANIELANPIRINANYNRQITVVPVIRSAETYTETTGVDLVFFFEQLT